MVDIEHYYTRSPSSGFWLLEFGPTFVGLISMDASHDALSSTVIGSALVNKKLTKGTSSIAVIRHFYVTETYRRAGAQDDLLAFAVQHAFEKSPAVEKLRAIPSPFSPYLGDALRKAGFKVVERGAKIGLVASLPSLTYELSRAKWEENTKE